MNLTLYPNGVALVRETIEVNITDASRPSEFVLHDVPKTIDPSTIRCVFDPRSAVRVLQCEFRPAIADRLSMLRACEGKAVRQTFGEEVWDGTLVSASPLLIQTFDGRLLVEPPGVTGVIASDPVSIGNSIRLTVEANAPGRHDCEISYHVTDISAEASYTCVVSGVGDIMDFQGTINIDNRSGVSFEEAVVCLVWEVSGGGQVIYPVNRSLDIRDGTVTSVDVVSASGCRLDREYVCPPASQVVYEGVSFPNDAEHGLGIDIPRGVARVYMSQSGSLFHLNTVPIPQADVGERIRFFSVAASDIVYCKRHVSEDGAMNVFLKNLTNDRVTVRIEEMMGEENEIVNSNLRFTRLDAQTVAATVELHPAGHFRATYRARSLAQSGGK